MATLPKIDGAAIFVNEMIKIDCDKIHREGRCCETLRQLIRAAAELKERCKVKEEPEEDEDDADDGGHKCDTCAKEFPTCEAIAIVFGIDVDRRAKGKEADRVVECGAYVSTKAKRQRDNWKARSDDSSPAPCSAAGWVCDCGLWHEAVITRCHACELKKQQNAQVEFSEGSEV